MNILTPVKCSPSEFKVAVVGAGIAGASCARALSAAGVSVHVVDKSRGAGGRLSTRRLEWLDPQGQRRSVKVDHGAPAFAASDPAFLQFLSAAALPGALERWSPALAAGSRPLHDAGPLWLPTPDMPSLCRGLLQDIPTTW
jgi:predicted NAD/FAD-dependent oxidoreductase